MIGDYQTKWYGHSSFSLNDLAELLDQYDSDVGLYPENGFEGQAVFNYIACKVFGSAYFDQEVVDELCKLPFYKDQQ